MSKIKLYLKEVYTEMVTKVTWPSWKDLQASAVVVMIASFIFAIVIFLMDFGFQKIMNFVYGLLL